MVLPMSGLRSDALGVRVALLQDVAELADDGAVALGDRELALQRGGIDSDRLLGRRRAFRTRRAWPASMADQSSSSRLTGKPPSAAVLTVLAL